MINVGKGIISGLIASALTFGGIYLLSASSLGYPLDPMLLTSGIMFFPVGLSWVVYLGLNVLAWGTLFALLSPLPLGPFWLKGILFGVGVWLLSAAIAWALEPSAVVPLAAGPAVLHLLFGLLLGLTYATLLDETERTGTPSHASRLHG